MSSKREVYLDANASAPLRPEVVEALLSFPRHSRGLAGNASSVHVYGRKAKLLIAEAREKVLTALSAKEGQVVFTSSGTEANQVAIRSILEPRLLSGKKAHWITTPVEHDSTLRMVKWLEARGGTVSYLPVDGNGVPVAEALSSCWKPETALVSVIWVNNETGVISDIDPIVDFVDARGGVLHLDAAQAFGKIPVTASCGASLMTFSGSKIGALPGSGFLWARDGHNIGGLLLGSQEGGARGGTENTLSIMALGIAASCVDPPKWNARVVPVRDALEELVLKQIPGVEINGAGANRVANTTNFTLGRSSWAASGETLVMALDLEGYCVSSGAACASGGATPSHVLMATGKSEEEAARSFRVSVHEGISTNDVEGFVSTLKRIVERTNRINLVHDA